MRFFRHQRISPPQPTSDSTCIIIRDMRVDMMVGLYDHEKRKPQPVLINLRAEVDIASTADGYDYRDVVCYERIANNIKNIAFSGHIELLENLAEEIAAHCLRDKKIRVVTIRVEKTEIFDFAAAVGIEITRKNK